MKSQVKYCYYCGASATSDEHVPPKGIFPVAKDVGKTHRKQLIKVPSCDKHNSQKSHDDEFLLICLASSIKGNKLGYLQFNSKVKRALERKYSGFINSIISNAKPAPYIDKYGNITHAISGKKNTKRLNSCFTSIAMGLYFHEFSSQFKGQIKTLDNIGDPQGDFDRNYYQLLDKTFNHDKTKQETKGENPEAFQYQFAGPDQNGFYSLKLTFYGGIYVYIALIPEGSKKTFDLGFELAKAGINVTYTFEDGDVTFN